MLTIKRMDAYHEGMADANAIKNNEGGERTWKKRGKSWNVRHTRQERKQTSNHKESLIRLMICHTMTDGICPRVSKRAQGMSNETCLHGLQNGTIMGASCSPDDTNKWIFDRPTRQIRLASSQTSCLTVNVEHKLGKREKWTYGDVVGLTLSICDQVPKGNQQWGTNYKEIQAAIEGWEALFGQIAMMGV